MYILLRLWSRTVGYDMKMINVSPCVLIHLRMSASVPFFIDRVSSLPASVVVRSYGYV